MQRNCEVCGGVFETKANAKTCSLGCHDIRRMEKKAANRKQYYADNSELIRSKAKQYYRANKERIALDSKIYRAENKNKLATRKRAYKYGITEEQYNLLLEAQGEVCAICKNRCRDSRGRGLAVDHDRMTGKIRGLLCSPCNQALGLFLDNKSILRNAIAYLEENE